MNIFLLDKDPSIASIYHNDRHVIKMILETAQLLCSAHQILDGPNDKLYRATHKNHPCSIWVRSCSEAYSWTYELFCSLALEYTFRYNKQHKSFLTLKDDLGRLPANIPQGPIRAWALAMPAVYKLDDPIESYRLYYKKEKAHLAKWTNRNIPGWWN